MNRVHEMYDEKGNLRPEWELTEYEKRKMVYDDLNLEKNVEKIAYEMIESEKKILKDPYIGPIYKRLKRGKNLLPFEAKFLYEMVRRNALSYHEMGLLYRGLTCKETLSSQERKLAIEILKKLGVIKKTNDQIDEMDEGRSRKK